MKRTPLKRSGYQLKRTPLKKVSAKRKVQLEAYPEVVKAVDARDHMICAGRRWQGHIGQPCFGAIQHHHLDGRVGEKLNDADRIISVCLAHHAWAHMNKREARTIGLMG